MPSRVRSIVQFVSVRVDAGPLDAVVTDRWFVENPAARGCERRLPDGQLAILVNLTDDRLSWAGPDLDRWHSVSGIAVAATLSTPVGLDRTEQHRTLDYVLAPGAAQALLGVPADALDPLVGLDELWGPGRGACVSGCSRRTVRPQCKPILILPCCVVSRQPSSRASPRRCRC